MIRNIILLIGACVIVTALTLATPYWIQSSKPDFAILKKGHAIADFDFQTLDGKKYSLSDFKGSPLVIHFWATWCPPCIVEFPELVKAAQKNKDIAVIAISTDRTQKAMERFLSKFDLPSNFHVVFDQNKFLTESYFGTYQLPETLIVESDGILKTKIIGAYTGWNAYDFN